MADAHGGAVLAARGLDKRFPGVHALRAVDFDVRAGEVVAVVGENGAGKSTLMKVLAGVLRPDAGTIALDGRLQRFRSVAAAQRAGVALIHQELSGCAGLDVAANVVLGRESRRALGRLDRERCDERARRALAALGLDVPLRTPLGRLSIADRQRVEIARAIDTGARIVIMDEPTSSLSSSECERLFALVRELAAGGTAVVHISHRLGEVEQLADRAVVLRDGAVVGELERAAIDHAALVRRMVGRDVARFFARTAHEPGERALAVAGLRTSAWPGSAVDLEVRSGEVVGLAGLLGSGRTEVLRALFGLEAGLAGEVTVGREVLHATGRWASPGRALEAGVALVPEDRQRDGLFATAGVARNLTIARLGRPGGPSSRGVVDRAGEERLAAELARRVGVRAASADVAVGTLSGGNQQKVLLGRSFAGEPRVLLLDEPTRGVDVGAKADIYALIDGLARSGVAVLFASSEMEELLGLADRCLVFKDGRVQGELARERMTEETVMTLATRAEPPGGRAGGRASGTAGPEAGR